jgi:glycerol-3-phosphate dehydrogenase (NAD(P)+)
MSRVAVIGSGSWGTALALVAARASHEVRLWSHSRDVALSLERDRENTVYLPGFPLPSNIESGDDLAHVVSGAEFVVVVVPSHVCRSVYSQLSQHLQPQMIVVSATKGIEISTQMRIEQVALDVLGDRFANRYVTLSGPSFAQEVARDEPCAVVAASRDIAIASAVQAALSSRRFRVYTNTDVTGVEIAGAIKNVLAIATGAVNGLGLGYNSAAALVTRGLAEMTRLVVKAGGRMETTAGLAGVGDLMLTCFGNLSRNRRVGFELGKGRHLEEIVNEMREVAEGVKTAKAAHELSKKLAVEMPVTTGVYEMLYEGKSPRDLEIELMERPLKGE